MVAPCKYYKEAAGWLELGHQSDEKIKFPMEPRFRAMEYEAYGSKGETLHTFTAAKVLQWHTANVGSKRGRDLFAPSFGKEPSSSDFKKWLRESFRMLLVGDKQEIEALVQAITPHSFRAGMAGDLERDDIPRPTIKKVGRWKSNEAMEQYMRDGLAQRLKKIRYWRIACVRGRVKRLSTRSCKMKIEEENSSEGYDDSEEDSE